jgi:hypothetical protein
VDPQQRHAHAQHSRLDPAFDFDSGARELGETAEIAAAPTAMVSATGDWSAAFKTAIPTASPLV